MKSRWFFSDGKWSWGSLNPQKIWFVETPTVVKLLDDIVVDVGGY